MIPRFIQEHLLCDSKKLVESFKELENMKTETKQKLKVGDKIVCITNAYKDFTKGKEYEIINVDSNNISVLNDYKVSINFLSLHNTFKLKDEKEELKPLSMAPHSLLELLLLCRVLPLLPPNILQVLPCSYTGISFPHGLLFPAFSCLYTT